MIDGLLEYQKARKHKSAARACIPRQKAECKPPQNPANHFPFSQKTRYCDPGCPPGAAATSAASSSFKMDPLSYFLRVTAQDSLSMLFLLPEVPFRHEPGVCSRFTFSERTSSPSTVTSPSLSHPAPSFAVASFITCPLCTCDLSAKGSKMPSFYRWLCSQCLGQQAHQKYLLTD